MIPTYSLIIPHYNIPHLLRRLLNTLPKRRDLQVIVVDDCSTDALKILEGVKRDFPWIEWYDTGVNGGGGKARNIGMKHAKGEYILFADADDFFNLNFSDILDKYKSNNYDITYFAASSLDTETYQNSTRGIAITTGVNNFIKSGDIDKLRYKFTNPWCKLISHKLILENDIRFQESLVYNDMHFSQQVDYYAKSFNADSNAIYCITSRNDSVSTVDYPDKEIEKVKVMIDFYKFYRSKGVSYSPMPLIAPTYFDLRKMGALEHAKRALRMWNESGISKFEIFSCIFLFRLHTFKNRIK